MPKSNFRKYAPGLFKMGYEPVPIPMGTKGLFESGWQEGTVTPERIKAWDKKYPSAGVGIRCGSLWAVDLDTYDEDTTEKLVDYLAQKFPSHELIERVGQAPKVLIPFRGHDKGKRKRYSTSYSDVFGVVSRIEILREGQQFVAYHEHPDTKKPYYYRGEGATPAEVGKEKLPVLTEEAIDELFEFFDTIVPDHWELKSESGGTSAVTGDVIDTISAKVDIAFSEVRRVVMEVPLDDDYQTWLNVGMGIHHQDKGQDGLALWKEWSSSSDKYQEEVCVSKWRTFGGGSGAPVTFATVLKMHQVQVGGSTKRELEGDTPPPSEAEDLTEFLKRYAFMPEGNAVVDLKRPVDLAVMEIASFRNLTANKRMEVPAPSVRDPEATKQEPVHKFWLTNNNRMTVEGTTYDPGTTKRITKGKDNRLFLNKAHFPNHKKLYLEEGHQPERLQVFLSHIDYLFPVREERDWFLGWLAFNIQRPADRCKVTPLHVSRHHRTGRGWIVELIERMLGEWNVTKAKMKHLSGDGSAAQFDEYLHESLVCAVEEVKEKDHRYTISDELRDILTENRLNLNLKYGGKGTRRVFTNFFWMSNHEDALVIPRNDKRIHVLTGPNFVQDKGYYDELYTWVKGEGSKKNLAQLWYYLTELDLTNFDWQTAPNTPGRMRMIDYNLTPTEAVFNSWLAENTKEYMSVAAICSEIDSLAEMDGYEDLMDSKQIVKLLQQNAFHCKQIRLGGRGSKRARPWRFSDGDESSFNPDKAKEALSEEEEQGF